MILKKLLILFIFYLNQQIISKAQNVTNNITIINEFPKNFSFGVATAAYQIEGGWKDDGKGPSIWDTFTHNNPNLIADKSNGDIAADSYHLFDQDLKAIKELGVNFYRFSISWSRILPNGNITSLNQFGIDYYNNIINKLIENNIEPMLTIHHFDLPQKLEQLGGFTDSIILQYYENYAAVLFKEFGDRVKYWITFNEPFFYCHYGYGVGTHAPGIKSPTDKEYLCIDYTIKAHAMVYRLYHNNYFDKYHGKVGIALNTRYYISDNEKLVDRAIQFNLGICAHPIYSKNGGYPDIVIEAIKRNKQKKGNPWSWSSLQQLNSTWKQLIKGSADFFGLNYYTSRLVISNTSAGQSASWERDSEIDTKIDKNWIQAQSSQLYHVPEGLEKILKYIRDNYGNIDVIITENGWSDKQKYNDDSRIMYIKDHLKAVLNAISDGCNVIGYTAWSLIDNFEWNRGYTEQFGLYSVDFSSSSKTRTAKKSAKYYKHVIKTRKLNGFSSSSRIRNHIDIIIFLIFVIFNL